jgi:hypothetical protein
MQSPAGGDIPVTPANFAIEVGGFAIAGDSTVVKVMG